MVRRGATALLLLLAVGAALPAKAGAAPVSVLYFFSFDCPHCFKALPQLERVSRTYRVRGIVLNARPGDLPARKEKLDVTFPVAAGDNAVRDAYGVRGVPTAVIVSRDGRAREKLVGEGAIQRIGELLDALTGGGAGILEIRQNPAAFDGKEVAVAGWLERLGGWGASRGTLFVSNGTDRIRVTPWRRLEPGNDPSSRAGEGSSVYEEPLVAIRGTVKRSGDSVFIETREGKPLR